MMHSLASTPRQILREVRVPAAMPYFFSALKVASALALIGAIVAEYFGGPQDVLGQYIISRANLFQFPDAWAAILVASLIGIGSYRGGVGDRAAGDAVARLDADRVGALRRGQDERTSVTRP